MAMVFISHSSRGDERAASVREQLRERLKTMKWDVKVDTDALHAGVEWRGQLYSWLADCDAAVILLNKAALESPWVQREVNILMWRQALGAPLTVVPVLLPDVEVAQIGKSAISEVTSLQLVRPAPGESAAGGVIEGALRLLPDLSALKAAQPDGSAMCLWTAKVIKCLIPVDAEHLHSAAEQLAPEEAWHFPSLQEGRRYVAHQFLGCRTGENVYQAVGTIGFGLPALADLIRLVSPTWIEGAAARQLVPFATVYNEVGGASERVSRRVVAALNSERSETARQYVDRASCCGAGYWVQTISLVAGESQDAEFRRDCTAAIRRLLHLEDDDQLDGVIPLKGDELYLVIDPNGVPLDAVDSLVAELVAHYPWLNVIVLTGTGEHSSLAWPRTQIRPLEPALQPQDEKSARRAIRAMADLLACADPAGKGYR
jgi:hypothetical protein